MSGNRGPTGKSVALFAVLGVVIGIVVGLMFGWQYTHLSGLVPDLALCWVAT